METRAKSVSLALGLFALALLGQESRVTIAAARLLDGRGGVVENVRVVVEGARIVAVERAKAGAPRATYELGTHAPDLYLLAPDLLPDSQLRNARLPIARPPARMRDRNDERVPAIRGVNDAVGKTLEDYSARAVQVSRPGFR